MAWTNGSNRLYFKNSVIQDSAEYIGSSWTAKAKWVKGVCSTPGCKSVGLYWDGGKKDFHFCSKHNSRLNE